jgi:hypothetical protein
LADSLGGKATLVEAMIRVAILGLTLQPFQDGLATGVWSDAELVTFQQSFESEKLLTNLDAALRGGERNSMTHFVVEMPRSELVDILRSFGVLSVKDYFFQKAVRWCPQGWLYQNAVHYSRVMQKQFDGYDVKQQRVFPEKCAAANAFMDEQLKTVTPFKYLVAIGVPNFAKCMQTTAEQQTFLQEAALACALERYRRARGGYPETLATLVPQFTGKLPRDLMTGEGLKYQRTAQDKFRLYSVGWNLKDDSGTRTTNRLAGDWVWPPAKL